PVVFMHLLHPDAAPASPEYRPSPRLAALRLLAQLVDESTKRNAAFGFIATRQITHVGDIGEDLLAAVLEGKADVRAGGIEQLGNRRGYRHAIAEAMEGLQQSQCIGNRGQFRRHLSGDSKRMKTPGQLAVLQQLLVADREQRTAQRGKYR